MENPPLPAIASGALSLGLEELLSVAGESLGEEVSPRTVRLYTSQGLIDRPGKEGRSAVYGRRQLLQLLLIRSLARRGLSASPPSLRSAGWPMGRSSSSSPPSPPRRPPTPPWPTSRISRATPPRCPSPCWVPPSLPLPPLQPPLFHPFQQQPLRRQPLASLFPLSRR